MSIVKEFREFAVKGNVIDMAVGVIIGTAFGKIVTSLVSDVIMPMIGVIIGGLNFQGLSLAVGDAKITYGNFIQSVVDFTIVALCIFVAVKMMKYRENSIQRLSFQFMEALALIRNSMKSQEALKRE